MKIHEDIVRMFSAGVTVAGIAAELKIPQSSVAAVLLRAGIEASRVEGPSEYDVPPEELVRQVLNAYHNNLNVARTCDRLGITVGRYWRIITEQGVPVRRFQVFDDLAALRRDVEVVSMYQDGLPLVEIVALTGVSQPEVHKTLERYNVPLRQPRRHSKDRGEFIDPAELLERLMAEKADGS